MASIRRHQILSAYPISYWPSSIYPSVSQSVSQSYESFSFTFRFRFQSICLAFLAVLPRRARSTLSLFLPPSLLPILQLTSEWAVFGMLFVRLIFLLLLLGCSIDFVCSVFKAGGEAGTGAGAEAEQTLPSNRVACCIFKYAFSY